jgi:hypothetical protein
MCDGASVAKVKKDCGGIVCLLKSTAAPLRSPAPLLPLMLEAASPDWCNSTRRFQCGKSNFSSKQLFWTAKSKSNVVQNGPLDLPHTRAVWTATSSSLAARPAAPSVLVLGPGTNTPTGAANTAHFNRTDRQLGSHRTQPRNRSDSQERPHQMPTKKRQRRPALCSVPGVGSPAGNSENSSPTPHPPAGRQSVQSARN